MICINFGEGDSSSQINNFLAIGTEEYPFNGIIKLVPTSVNTLNIPEAFFDYIYDSAKIISSISAQPSPLVLTRTFNNTGEPVLARHVKHNNEDEAVTWQIQLDRYNSTDNFSVGGFIGEMENDAEIILDVIDNTSCNTYGTDDIGYICGKLDAGSSLTVNSIKSSTGNGDEKQIIDPTNTSYSISTTVGNAGGVVGSMADHSKLILNCAMSNPSASITATGSGNYAGGIVGSNDGGIVVSGIDTNDSPIFSSSEKYSIMNTLVGVEGAGGVFGYYRPYFTSSETAGDVPVFENFEFDASWIEIGGENERLSANGTGSVGGLFGMLVNEIAITEGNPEIFSVPDDGTQNGDDPEIPEPAGESEQTTTYSSGNITIKNAAVYLDHSDANNVTNYGGLIGKYTACDLDGSLEVKDTSVNVAKSVGTYDNFGGAIAVTEGGTGNEELDSLYVKFDTYSVTVASGNNTATSVYGGLIARSTNAFVDAKDVTCNSTYDFYGGGVIGRMDDGVLRLSGTTNLTGGYAKSSDKNYYYEGQIVGGRDSSLVFAEKDWILKRSNACSIDDIGS